MVMIDIAANADTSPFAKIGELLLFFADLTHIWSLADVTPRDNIQTLQTNHHVDSTLIVHYTTVFQHVRAIFRHSSCSASVRRALPAGD